MKYLDVLESKMGKNKIQDNIVYQCLVCEIMRINTILDEASEEYNDTHFHSEKLEEVYSFEKEYKKRVLELLLKLD